MGRPRKKPDSAAEPDRHKNPKKTLRLPEHVGKFLNEMADAEDRTITAVVMRALKLYAQQNGYPWPTPRGEKPD